MSRHVLRISESVWRPAADTHQSCIRELLRPGLLRIAAPRPDQPGLVSETRPPTRQAEHSPSSSSSSWTALDQRHPVYNFLIEYYGLKGAKGPRRLARWSPDFASLHPLVEDEDPPPWLSDQKTQGDAGILLEGASTEDLGGTLHLRGATLVDGQGILYSPARFVAQTDNHNYPARIAATTSAGSYLWYRGILKQTLQAEPILHCYGLHEWAMQYQPRGAPAPPSGQYQAHLPLRCSRQVINELVERKNHLSCTHYDALRFFAPAAQPLNTFGSMDTLTRQDQLRLEQPACVHAQMDLLKMVLRLQPFGGADLVRRVLTVALEARRLDVAASPYDVSSYGIEAVPVETTEGRWLYRARQMELMQQADSVRRDLLQAYEVFLHLAFGKPIVKAPRKPNTKTAVA